jgi:polyribonucleotide nucleotidyltransferase
VWNRWRDAAMTAKVMLAHGTLQRQGEVIHLLTTKLEDLSPGMELRGTILNVVDFGAFVDVGLADSGLVHISQLADRYVADLYATLGRDDRHLAEDALQLAAVAVDHAEEVWVAVGRMIIQPIIESTALREWSVR